MRGLLELDSATSPRMAIAIDQLASGLGFTYRGVWFRRDDSALRCEVISPWHGRNLDDAAARALLANAVAAFDDLASESVEFVTAVAPLVPSFAIIEDYDIGSVGVAEWVDDDVVWAPAFSLELPEDLGDKAQAFGESSYGANRVTLVLLDGRRVPHVHLAGGRMIVKVGSRQVSTRGDLDFSLGDIVDVISEA